jgi:hypothetical protein
MPDFTRPSSPPHFPGTHRESARSACASAAGHEIKSSESLKRHMMDYFLFCILSYGLVSAVWIKIAGVYSMTAWALVSLLSGLLLSTMAVLLAAVIQNIHPKMKILGGVLLPFALASQIYFLIKLAPTVLTDYATGVLVLFSLAASLWSIPVYFTGLDKEKNKLIGRKIVKYFILSAFLFYVPTLFLGRYYKQQIDKIFAAGSVNVAGGLNSAQIEKMIDATLRQANMIHLLLTLFVVILFFFLYRKVKVSVENQ